MSLVHLKIGTRLGIGFATVLALLVLTIVLGLGSMSRIGQRTMRRWPGSPNSASATAMPAKP